VFLLELLYIYIFKSNYEGRIKYCRLRRSSRECLASELDRKWKPS